MSNEDLADLIQQNYGFSDARSENIARTETALPILQETCRPIGRAA